MKKIIVFVVLTAFVSGAGGYYLYRLYFTDLVADALMSESLPAYLPQRLKDKMEAVAVPLNLGAEAVIREMKTSRISMDQVLTSVDKISEEQANALLDDLKRSKPKTTDAVFDLAKKHIAPDFDIEIFRKPFNDYVTMKQINQAIRYASKNRQSENLDIKTTKVIIKKILVQKEAELKNGK